MALYRMIFTKTLCKILPYSRELLAICVNMFYHI